MSAPELRYAIKSELALLTKSQVTLMLHVHGPHTEE